MPKWRIQCSWEMYGSYEIEADTQEEAVAEVEADDTPLPTNGDFIVGSFKVDHDGEIGVI